MTIYRIGEVEFDPDASEIYTEGHHEHLQPQVRNVLLCLVRHRGEVVPKEQLVNEAWNGRHTSDESVTRCISILRKHLSDRSERRVIETIPKTGYRLLDSVQQESVRPDLTLYRAANESRDIGQTRKLLNLLVTVATLLALISVLLIFS